MAAYAISFRIGHELNSDKRYSSVIAAIGRQAIGGTWEETTSLVLIQSNKSAAEIASAIFLGSDFSPSFDLLLVFGLDNGEHSTRGDIKYPATLASFFRPPSSPLGDMMASVRRP